MCNKHLYKQTVCQWSIYFKIQADIQSELLSIQNSHANSRILKSNFCLSMTFHRLYTTWSEQQHVWKREQDHQSKIQPAHPTLHS